MEQTTPRNRFIKMHGLGNDFVIHDIRHQAQFPASADQVRAMADRHFGIGCDTFASLHRGSDEFDAMVTFYNGDGSMASACGNASRCVAKLLMEEIGKDRITLWVPDSNRAIADLAGTTLICDAAEDGQISVNMGQPVLEWQKIPLAEVADIDALPLPGAPSAVAMPNPHCVFFVENADTVDPAQDGPEFEAHALFPDRANVEFVSLTAPDHLRMRVYERGGMVTLACGSGACAAVVAAHRRGLTGKKVQVDLDGGTLHIDWRDDGVWMTGPATHVAEITFHPDFLNSIL